MPRRLDPEKGMPGLFARGGAARDMEFLVEKPEEAQRERRARKTASRKLKRPRAGRPRPIDVAETPGVEVAVRVVTRLAIREVAGTEVPIPVRVAVEAPPPRRVPEPRDDGLAWREVPSLVACALGWAWAALRTAR